LSLTKLPLLRNKKERFIKGSPTFEIMPTSQVNLEAMTLGEIILAQMLSEIPNSQLKEAQELVVERVDDGEAELREFSQRIAGKYLPSKSTHIIPCTNYLDYLNSLQKFCGLNIDDLLKNQDITQDQSRFLRQYLKLKKQEPDLVYQLQTKEVFYEMIHCPGTKKRGQAIYIGVRRKDLNRAVRKTAKKILEAELAEVDLKNISPEIRRKMFVDDLFGLRVCAHTEEQATYLAYREFYEDLVIYGYMPDSFQSPRNWSKRHLCKVSGFQKSGVDDHYQYGNNNSHQVQIKFRRNDYESTIQSTPGIWEITFTDVFSVIIGQMEHLDFRRKQERRDKREYGNKYALQRYDELIDLGNPIQERLNPNRKRVLAPHFYFK